jgi:hypothetical protein
LVAGHNVEGMSIRKTKYSFAVHEHLTVGEFHNLLHLTRRKPIGHRPMTLPADAKNPYEHAAQQDTEFTFHRLKQSLLGDKVINFY